jgi:D-sedoheptulose 7-phosphate isomerase
MKNANFFEKSLRTINDKILSVDTKVLLSIATKIREVNRNKGKIIVVGNGGSSAIASHVSIDLTKSANVRSINFNESSLLTCFSNDYGYSHWVEKAIEFYADKRDLIILISSSGQSKNIINGAITAKEMNIPLITLSGFLKNNLLREMGDINLWVDSQEYNTVESTHQVWLLSVVDYLIDGEKNNL